MYVSRQWNQTSHSVHATERTVLDHGAAFPQIPHGYLESLVLGWGDSLKSLTAEGRIHKSGGLSNIILGFSKVHFYVPKHLRRILDPPKIVSGGLLFVW